MVFHGNLENKAIKIHYRCAWCVVLYLRTRPLRYTTGVHGVFAILENKAINIHYWCGWCVMVYLRRQLRVNTGEDDVSYCCSRWSPASCRWTLMVAWSALTHSPNWWHLGQSLSLHFLFLPPRPSLFVTVVCLLECLFLSERERERERASVRAEVCFDCVLVVCFVMGYALQFGEVTHKRVHYYLHYYYYYHSCVSYTKIGPKSVVC